MELFLYKNGLFFSLTNLVSRGKARLSYQPVACKQWLPLETRELSDPKRWCAKFGKGKCPLDYTVRMRVNVTYIGL